jgi:hypothetical protein
MAAFRVFGARSRIFCSHMVLCVGLRILSERWTDFFADMFKFLSVSGRSTPSIRLSLSPSDLDAVEL